MGEVKSLRTGQEYKAPDSSVAQRLPRKQPALFQAYRDRISDLRQQAQMTPAEAAKISDVAISTWN